MYKQFVFLLCLLGPALMFGQADTLLLKENYDFAARADDAMYIRVVKAKNDDGTFSVVDWLKTGEKFFEGSVTYLNAGIHINDFAYYYPNGKIQWSGHVENLPGQPLKNISEKDYFPNGQLRSELVITNYREKFPQAFDSLGNSTIINGRGTASIEFFYNHTLWIGGIKEFEQDSIWTATDLVTGKVLHVEFIKKDKVIWGKSFTANGEVSYTDKTVFPDRQILKAAKYFRREVKALVGTSKGYILLAIVSKGHITDVVHLIKDKNERRLDVSRIKLPADLVIYERGVPCEVTSLVLRL
jgi:antitoxin component YwqK of YwqJK toxin-antitoxin module